MKKKMTRLMSPDVSIGLDIWKVGLKDLKFLMIVWRVQRYWIAWVQVKLSWTHPGESLMRGGPVFLAFFILFGAASYAVPVPLFPGNMVPSLFNSIPVVYSPLIGAVANGIFYGCVVWLVFLLISRRFEEPEVTNTKSKGSPSNKRQHMSHWENGKKLNPSLPAFWKIILRLAFTNVIGRHKIFYANNHISARACWNKQGLSWNSASMNRIGGGTRARSK
jgi:hypothetical protein